MKSIFSWVKDRHSSCPGCLKRFKETCGFISFQECFLYSDSVTTHHLYIIDFVSTCGQCENLNYCSNSNVNPHHLWTIYIGCELEHQATDTSNRFSTAAPVLPHTEKRICLTSRASKDAKAGWLLPLTLEMPITHWSFVDRHAARSTCSHPRSKQTSNMETLNCGHRSQVHSVPITSHPQTSQIKQNEYIDGRLCCLKRNYLQLNRLN